MLERKHGERFNYLINLFSVGKGKRRVTRLAVACVIAFSPNIDHLQMRSDQSGVNLV